MEYSKETSGTAECYGIPYNPIDKTVTFCYRGAPNVVIQPEDFTDTQKSAVKAYASAFGVSEFSATKAVIEKDIDDAIAEIIASKETEPLEVK